MKNKKVIYILLPTVLLIWAIVIYKIYAVVNDKETLMPKKVVLNAFVPSEHVEEHYELLLNYNDPFLTGKVGEPKSSPKVSMAAQISKSITEPKKEVPPPVRKEDEINWKVVAYQGMIENNNEDRKIALVLYNGKSCFLREEQTFDEFQVVGIYKDSIRLKCKDEEKCLLKKK
jgi:hypothetical protein